MDVLRTVFSWRRKNAEQVILEESPQKMMKLHEEKKEEEETCRCGKYDVGEKNRCGKCEELEEKNKKKKNIVDYEYSSGEDDDYVWPDGTRRRTREEWARYYKQIEESEGFDVDPFTGDLELGLRGVDGYDSEPIIKCAKAAIERFNSENNMSYEFLKLEKITCIIASGLEYRLTFRAADGEAEPKMFQAITFLGIDDSIIVDFCRLKSTASS
uniref:Cystatin domain-containing protein n=1 Tax=Ananas comosus var. bracteatus TaxID=296719 RepID=A0A6V7P478_ANACO|nr:unnamed protein product [Ananas comosus var. bracteatus]